MSLNPVRKGILCPGKVRYLHTPWEPLDEVVVISWNKLRCLCPYVVSNSFVTPWTEARQTPVSVGFPRQEYWSGLPFPSLGIFPTHG